MRLAVAAFFATAKAGATDRSGQPAPAPAPAPRPAPGLIGTLTTFPERLPHLRESVEVLLGRETQ